MNTNELNKTDETYTAIFLFGEIIGYKIQET